jgi:hypothetical protein
MKAVKDETKKIVATFAENLEKLTNKIEGLGGQNATIEVLVQETVQAVAEQEAKRLQFSMEEFLEKAQRSAEQNKSNLQSLLQE